MTTVAYEKGFQFLARIQKVLGEFVMQDFLKNYMMKFSK
jgi:hypothetical protein